MSVSKEARDGIIKEIITQLGTMPDSFSASELAKKHGMSIQSVYRYLNTLETDGTIEKLKKGNRNVFRLKAREHNVTYPLDKLSEDSVWSRVTAPFFAALPQIPKANLAYAFMEMLNNAIDHSGGSEVSIHLAETAYSAQVVIRDNGIGIFTKIADAMALEEKRFAILELAKGKFTTDPNSHTGEGIFFSSKVMDRFMILSDGLAFSGQTTDGSPYIDDADTESHGTTVIMEITREHSEPSSAVFDRFTQAPEDYGFSKTIVPVRLLEYGDAQPLVISRSQAKRLMVRFERFENIVLDFTGIDEIGQGFADELFRVFPSLHPDSKLIPINCSAAVERMIKRVTAEKKI